MCLLRLNVVGNSPMRCHPPCVPEMSAAVPYGDHDVEDTLAAAPQRWHECREHAWREIEG